jgi:hypothetical protein
VDWRHAALDGPDQAGDAQRILMVRQDAQPRIGIALPLKTNRQQAG